MRKMLFIGVTVVGIMLCGCTAQGTGVPDPTDTQHSPEVEPGFLAVADTSLPGGGTFNVYLDYDMTEAAGLDPQGAVASRAWAIESLAYDTLVRVAPDFSYTPGLATAWREENPTTYVFELRDDVKFSNGRLMTPEDVKGSIERLQAAKSVWSAQLGPVQSVEVTGAHEVTVSLAQPYTPFLGALSNTPAAIVPIEEIESGEIDPSTEMLGTGPFVLKSHTQDVSWTFERNPHYYDAEKLGIDEIDIKIAPDEANRLAAMRDGSADYAFFNNVDSVSLLSGIDHTEVATQATTDLYVAFLNDLNGGPLEDAKLRQAINAIIDREQLGEIAMGGAGTPTGITPVTLPDACDPAKLPSATMSDDDIREQLKASGGSGLTLTMVTIESASKVAQVIQQQLSEFGVTLDVQIVDGATFSSTWGGSAEPAKPDMGISWYSGYGDASMVTRWWNTDVSTSGQRYMAGSAKINELIVDASQAAAGAERAKVFTALCDEVDSTSERVPLVTRPGFIAYRSDAVSPTINSTEGYSNMLRYIVDFRLTK